MYNITHVAYNQLYIIVLPMGLVLWGDPSVTKGNILSVSLSQAAVRPAVYTITHHLLHYMRHTITFHAQHILTLWGGLFFITLTHHFPEIILNNCSSVRIPGLKQ